MEKESISSFSIFWIYSILPWWISLSFQKRTSLVGRTDKGIPGMHLQKLHIRIHNETIQLIKLYNDD
ncbi:Chloroplast envelope membrane protein, partial [Bienertia sinuspersici]